MFWPKAFEPQPKLLSMPKIENLIAGNGDKIFYPQEDFSRFPLTEAFILLGQVGEWVEGWDGVYRVILASLCR